MHGLNVVPGFVGASAGDYSLGKESDLIDAGVIIPGINDEYEGNAPDVGAYEFEPALALHAAPGDTSIRLNWEANVTLPPTTTWHVDYYTETASIYTVADPYSTTRSLVLTEHVRNYQWYTVTLHAMMGGTFWLGDTVRAMPTDRFVYLPLVLRGR